MGMTEGVLRSILLSVGRLPSPLYNPRDYPNYNMGEGLCGRACCLGDCQKTIIID